MPYREEFDAALFYDALHHAENERAALAATYEALRPGGVCITVEPGEGHGVASAGIAAELGVTEKDMPPHHIIAVGREVGFRRFRVYARTAAPAILTSAGLDDPLPLSEHQRSRWQVVYGFARKALRALALGVREGDREFLLHAPSSLALRMGNIVWMQK